MITSLHGTSPILQRVSSVALGESNAGNPVENKVLNLKLSDTRAQGPVPSWIGKLHKHSNIPPQIALLDRLKSFSVADNFLSGPVPEFVKADSSVNANYTNNLGLCGGPLGPCKRHRNEFYSSFKTGFVAGYTVFAVSIIVGFLSCCVPWVRLKRRNKMIRIPMVAMLMMRKNRKEADNIRGSPTVEFIHGGKEISMLEKMVPRMGYKDLNDATNTFSKHNVIGQGKMGMLYKAALPNGYLLAVKKLDNSQFFEEQFILELKTLGILRHVNLLPLLGFCITSKYMLLVYKYMPNANLYDWLHPMEGQTKIMEWDVRFKVAIGLARGLAWLHQDCSSAVRVIHLNISSKCVLLDQNFEPKLSNFGEAIIISPTSTSYVNGESWDTIFAKEDVYGLGVVLLELITGVDFSKMTDSSSGSLNDWLIDFLNRPDFSDAIDKSLIGKGFDAEIFQVLKVACNCVDTIPDQRPTMLQAYNDIKAIREERRDLVDEAEILTQHEIC
ncbi:unnamed protein product [Dovyalis caffra]|uniref:Protein kinase domain-containing protein n=1 Tax=Dovyalis caffra TaxID=77055 RepID=A0AAV1QT90_9ROSI|nr:unnamed protein product [Dovyalis caffra]